MKKVTENAAQVPEKPAGQFQSALFEWGETLVILFTVITLLFAFVLRPVIVKGESMHPTLADREIIATSALFYTPAKGDIVVLSKAGFYGGEQIVKRVIATEGDTVDINWETGDVLINGEALLEPYIAEKINRRTVLQDTVLPQTVPENCVFVMGDNRNHSSDSRESALGMVDRRHIAGRVLVRIWPFSRLGAVL